MTENQLLEELRLALGATSADAFTTTELARKWNVSSDRVRKRLAKLLDAGMIATTHKVVVNSHGVELPVPAYRMAN